DSAFERTVGEIEPIALHAGGDRSVQIRGHRAGGAGLVPGQTEVADLHRLRRIAQVVDLEHARCAPAGYAGHEAADARAALPPALVRVPVVSADAGNEARMRRIGDVPDFVRETAEGPQQIDCVGIALRQALAVADARHLRAAFLGAAFRSRNVREIFRP